MATTKKIGLYIYSGDGISDALDCNALVEKIQSEGKVHICKVLPDLCSKTGVEKINDDIKNEGINAIVIAGSSPRYHTDLFQFEGIVTERVSLRELVAWTHEPNDPETQNLALDYIRMGIAKAEGSDIPEPMILDINDAIMVVGGGVTGMNAALASAKAGYNVVLIEKEKELGGFYKKIYKLSPRKLPYYELEQNPCNELIDEVYSNKNIQVLTSSQILETTGQPGMFDVTVQKNGSIVKFQVGAIIQATGWVPYNPEKLSYLGYGTHPNIITNVQMEDLAKNDNIKRPNDGKPIKSVVFIQCAGSRNKDHLPYCSTVCCLGTFKQAMYLREKYPDCLIYVIYQEIRTMGVYERFYKRVQNEDNIFLTKGEIESIETDNSDKIVVNVTDTLLGEPISIEADMVVLATGLVPTTKVDEEQNETKEEAKDDKPVVPKAAGEEGKAKILNLTYRQGTDLPTLFYGFPDSHYICFPYETRRTGIYAAGTVRAPMDTVASKNDAYGAALKAIQAIENIRKGTAVHPRAGDKSFADFFLQRCTQCKRCTEECPFGTLDEDTKGTPKYNPNRCRRCGICMGACPERIISFKDYSVQIISAVIKSIYIPKEEIDGEATPRIIAFLCENDAYPSLDIIAKHRVKFSSYIRIIPVRCLGSVNTSWIADALSAGFDGAILIGCKYGEDYQCHYIRGSELANKRMENVQEKLKQLVLEPERVEIHALSIDEYDKIPEIFNNFAKVIERVGPNPYKEM